MEDLYKTKDLGLAAALLTMGKKLEKSEKKDFTTHFFFQEKPKCKEIEKKYFARKLSIDAWEFNSQIRYLKQVIFGH